MAVDVFGAIAGQLHHLDEVLAISFGEDLNEGLSLCLFKRLDAALTDKAIPIYHSELVVKNDDTYLDLLDQLMEKASEVIIHSDSSLAESMGGDC